jgi:hypothetical protein
LVKENGGITIQQERIYKKGLELKKKKTEYKIQATTEKIPVYNNNQVIIKYTPPHIKMMKIPKLQIQTLNKHSAIFKEQHDKSIIPNNPHTFRKHEESKGLEDEAILEAPPLTKEEEIFLATPTENDL